MFGKNFGVYCVMGNFWSGKTSWTFLDLSKVDKRKTYIIANVKYSFVDKFFNTPKDLSLVLDSVINYCKITNKDIKKYYEEREKYKDIILVVDEAHLYFDSRNRKNYSSSLDVILSQCRKRNIKVLFISQRLKRVDLNIRRLADFVIRYRRERKPIFIGFEWVKRFIYSNEGDLADIQWDDQRTYITNGENPQVNDIEKSEVDKNFFTPLFRWSLWKLKREPFAWEWLAIADQKHLSLYISGLDDERINERDPFLKDILVEEKIEEIIEPLKIQKSKNYLIIFQEKIKKYCPTFYKFYFKLLDYARSNNPSRYGKYSKQFIRELNWSSWMNKG